MRFLILPETRQRFSSKGQRLPSNLYRFVQAFVFFLYGTSRRRFFFLGEFLPYGFMQHNHVSVRFIRLYYSSFSLFLSPCNRGKFIKKNYKIQLFPPYNRDNLYHNALQPYSVFGFIYIQQNIDNLNSGTSYSGSIKLPY